MKLKALFLTFWGSLTMLSCQNNTQGIDAKLKALINSDSTFLVDVRTPQEYSEEHVEGSENIPLNTIESNLEKFEGKKDIIVFCRSGKRSANAKEILESHGFKNITNGFTWKNVQKHKASNKEVINDSK